MRTYGIRRAVLAATAILALAGCTRATVPSDDEQGGSVVTSPSATGSISPSSGAQAGGGASSGGSGGGAGTGAGGAGGGGGTGGSGGTGRGGTGGGDTDDDGVAWVPYGPAVPGSPDRRAQYYGYLYQHDCRSLTDDTADGVVADLSSADVTLYGGVGAACIALSGNDQQRWHQADDALTSLRGGSGLDCLGLSAYRLLADLVAAHHRHPDRAPRLGPAGTGKACPWSVTGIEPTSAPADEYVAITIRGVRLWGVTAVLVGARRITSVEVGGGGDLTVAIPAGSPPGTVSVVVEQGPAGTATAAQKFTFLPAAGGESSAVAPPAGSASNSPSS